MRVRREVPVALWPIVLVIYATLLPREMRVELGGLMFFADRIGLVLILPYVIKKLMEGAIRFVLPDFLVLFAGMWMITAMMVNYGFADGLRRGGSLALDSSVGYFLARISFRSLTNIRKVLILIAPGMFAVGMIIMVESVTRREIIEPFAEQVFGKLPLFVGGEAVGFIDRDAQIRLGLMRAKGPFQHPILAGLYLATLVGLYNLSGIRGWPRWLGNIAGLCAFFTASSAALLALALSYFLVAFERFHRMFKELNWRLLIFAGAMVILIIEIFSDSGFISVLSRYATLNPATAYYRQLVWTFGVESVLNHPWFGIGFASYERPDWMTSGTVDAHWLLVAMRFGLPAAIALLLAVVLALVALGRASTRISGVDQGFYRGIATSLFVMALFMFTVTLWGGMLSWFNLLIGACVSCAQHSYFTVGVKFVDEKAATS